MSELINNNQSRKEDLKNLILKLHDGAEFEVVKKEFQEKFGTVSTVEITQMEQQLMAEGMPVSEIKRLCDVHAAVFDRSIEEIHRPTKELGHIPGHPVHTFKLENRALEKVVEDIKGLLDEFTAQANADINFQMLEKLNLLFDIDKHYSRKENLLFPFIEKYGVTGPSKVMWSHDDDIRTLIKNSIREVKSGKFEPATVVQYLNKAFEMIADMIYKEENILFPTSSRFLTEEEWFKIAEESGDIGYCIASPEARWVPESVKGKEAGASKAADGFIKLETGILTVEELEGIFRHLPIDVTFVDKDDTVKFFSHSPERIFVRTKAIIGRNVTNCHPPASVHVVEEIVNDFKSGKKDSEDFWIPLGDMFVLIRYFAVRDADGNYMGAIETTQNIKPLQEITGTKRLMSK